ncbi:MAG: hypothetical protein LBD20_10345 [Spirochaetaceae bacterium]|jgi:hypothetical protein|nr:hypothetical protein [Spirochaetaceae bacterium]
MNVKKSICITVLALTLGVGAAFADHPDGFGIGLQGGWFGEPNGGLTLKFPKVPVFWSINADKASLAVAGDYYFIDHDFMEGLGFYIGVGAYAGLGVWGWDDGFNLWAGVRVPIGLSWRPLDLLEIYLQAVPSIGLRIIPPRALWPNFIGGNLGIRFWF